MAFVVIVIVIVIVCVIVCVISVSVMVLVRGFVRETSEPIDLVAHWTSCRPTGELGLHTLQEITLNLQQRAH